MSANLPPGVTQDDLDGHLSGELYGDDDPRRQRALFSSADVEDHLARVRRFGTCARCHLVLLADGTCLSGCDR